VSATLELESTLTAGVLGRRAAGRGTPQIAPARAHANSLHCLSRRARVRNGVASRAASTFGPARARFGGYLDLIAARGGGHRSTVSSPHASLAPGELSGRRNWIEAQPGLDMKAGT
jgi:hypothetical protein